MILEDTTRDILVLRLTYKAGKATTEGVVGQAGVFDEHHRSPRQPSKMEKIRRRSPEYGGIKRLLNHIDS